MRFAYLDFSTLARREAACRAELRLNRRLAPTVYLDVVPLTVTPRGLAIGGSTTITDWLVVMRRLDESRTLEHAILQHRIEPWQLERLTATLVQFYRRAAPVLSPPAVHLRDWHDSLADNLGLLDPRLAACRRAWSGASQACSGNSFSVMERRWPRVRDRRIVDGHGDLRPEHIWPVSKNSPTKSALTKSHQETVVLEYFAASTASLRPTAVRQDLLGIGRRPGHFQPAIPVPRTGPFLG